MTAADIVSWSNPYISQLSPIILILAIVVVSERLVNLAYDTFRR